MSVLQHNPFHRPVYLFNKHLETIIPALCRKVNGINFTRERICTADNDFSDIDWLIQIEGLQSLIILSHGLEGNSRRPYILGMTKLFFENKFDICAWNYRGCSGEDNNSPFPYHTGKTDDLLLVINHAIKKYNYDKIYLVGFSMGGNTTLKFLGDGKYAIPPQVKKAVAISPPCDLSDSADELDKGFNTVYGKRFVNRFKEKMKMKYKKFPDIIPIEKLKLSNSVRLFDEYFTAPLNGFGNAQNFYNLNSSKQFIPHIYIPTFILMAANDPLIGKKSFPVKECENNAQVFLEITKYGGHSGFKTNHENYYDEIRALEFIRDGIE